MDKDLIIEEDLKIDTSEGKNYRDIATIMSRAGYQMNHSSVRNYVIRIMKQFAHAYVSKNNIDISKISLNMIAQSPIFQQGIADVLHALNRNTYNNNKDGNVERNVKESTQDNT